MAILLTQSQVSVAVSSAVVVFFTLLLFLAGVSIQRQSTNSLREAIKPRLPQPPPSLNLQSQRQQPLSDQISASRHFGGSLGSNGRVAFQKFIRVGDRPEESIDWTRLAHAQLVGSHHDLCNAIMIFGELHRLKSPAKRVLMFPAEWASEKQKTDKSDVSDPYMDSSRRLMRLAARRYGVELRPVSPISHGQGDESQPSDFYSLASAFALAEYERVMVLETPGLLIDARPLDGLLAFMDREPFAMLHDTVANDGVHSQDLFLLQPNKGTFAEMETALANATSHQGRSIAEFFPEPLLIASSDENSALVRSIGALHDVERDFNQTAYLENVAYLRFSDPKLPGPEYDVPWHRKREARPKNKDADWMWTKLYGQFAQKRVDICGLDLEHWRGDD